MCEYRGQNNKIERISLKWERVVGCLESAFWIVLFIVDVCNVEAKARISATNLFGAPLNRFGDNINTIVAPFTREVVRERDSNSSNPTADIKYTCICLQSTDCTENR